jgi:putative Mg2+ transporter-C (MgtC) family protein
MRIFLGGDIMENIWGQLEWLLRLVVAGICGFLIGYERKNRLKEAGVRTHIIVALGAALIMIISKYGFMDVLPGGDYDPTRIAAQIVSGIGFLGAGMIFIRKQAISGLTTAAGIWTTAGIGMAIGTRLYFIGIAATILMLTVQVLLHRNYRWFHLPVTEQMTITMSNEAALTLIKDKFAASGIEIIHLRAERRDSGSVDLELHVKLPQDFDVSGLMNMLRDNPHVKSIEL